MPSVQIKSNQYDFNEILSGLSNLNTSELEQFIKQASNVLARKKTPNPPEKELILIAKIYQALDNSTQKRYDELSTKMNAEKMGQGKISPKEHAELLKLVAVTEQHNVEWLSSVVELAKLRKTSVDEIVKQLGIQSPTIK